MTDELWAMVRLRPGSNALAGVDVVVEKLCRTNWIIKEAERSVADDADHLVSLREGPLAQEIQVGLVAADAPYPFIAGRIIAVAHVAEAARRRRHGHGGEAPHLEAAIESWSCKPSCAVCRWQVDDFLRHLVDGPVSVEPAQLDVPVRDPRGIALVTVEAELVPGGAQGLWPCPCTMAFTLIDDATATSLANFHPSGAEGVRWRIRANRKIVTSVPKAALAVPFATLAYAMAHRKTLDKHVTIVAEAAPDGTLTPVKDAEELASYAVEHGYRAIVARTAEGESATSRSGFRPVSDLSQAFDIARSRRTRRLGALVTAGVVLLAGIGILSLHERQQADRRGAQALRTKQAEALASQVIAERPNSPKSAVNDALTAQRTAPGSLAARSALLTAVYGDPQLTGFLRGVPDSPERLAMSGDGHAVAVSGGGDIAVWPISGEHPGPPRTLRGVGPVTALAMSPDGRTLAAANPEHGVTTFDVDGTASKRLQRAGASIRSLVFARRGTRIAAATSTGAIVWVGGHSVRAASGSDIAAVALDETGHLLATTGEDRQVTIWRVGDTKARRLAHDFIGSSGTSVMFSPDGRTLYATGYNGMIHRIDPRTGRNRFPAVRYAVGDRVVAVTATEYWVAYSGRLNVFAAEEKSLRSADLFPSRTTSLGGPLAAVSGDGTVRVTESMDRSFAVRKEHIPQRPAWYSAGVSQAEPLSGGSLAFGVFAPLSPRAVLAVFDWQTGKPVAATRFSHVSMLSSTDFSAATRTAAVATADRHVQVWHFDGARSLNKLADLPPPAADQSQALVAFDDSKRRMLAVWGSRLVVYSYDGAGAPRVLSSSDLPRPLTCLAFDSTRSTLVGCSSAGIESTPIDTGGRLGRSELLTNRRSALVRVASDGSVVGADTQGDLTIYRAGGEYRLSLTMYPANLPVIVGGTLVTVDRTEVLHIVDIATHRSLLDSRLPTSAEAPMAIWGTPDVLHLRAGFGAELIDMPMGLDLIRKRACELEGASAC